MGKNIHKMIMPMALAAMAWGFLAASASANDIVDWTGPSDFDDETISFTAITANSIIGIDAGSGDAYSHAHGGSTTMFIDLHIDGVWTNVYSHAVGSNGAGPDEFYLHDITTPINFAYGTVDGMRIYANPTIGNAFHGFGFAPDLPSFEFSTVSAVPEPSSLALAGLGGIGLIVGAIRRRRTTV